MLISAESAIYQGELLRELNTSARLFLFTGLAINLSLLRLAHIPVIGKTYSSADSTHCS